MQIKWSRSLRVRITAASFVFICNIALSARAQIGGSAPSAADVSPTTNTDVSSMITTGSGYDAWTGSSRREVTDLVVPGAVSEHGLKWTRTYNSDTGQWSFGYTWRYFSIVPRNFEIWPLLVG